MAQWYYAQDDQQHGPVSAAALKLMAQEGQLGRDDLIWREGMQRWAPAHKVRGLFAEPSESSAGAVTNGQAVEQEAVAEDAAAANAARVDSAAAPESESPATDVIPVDAYSRSDAGADDGEDDEASAASRDEETAIDVLPLGGPEESKLHVPVLTAPARSPSALRSASNEMVVFEPAAGPPPRQPAGERTSESDHVRPQDATAARQLRIDAPPRSGGWLAGAGLFAQTFTWVTCLLVILVGGVVYLSALMMTGEASQRLSASGIYATFVVASYFLARSTERICRACGQWLGVSTQRKTRRTVRERNWQRFQ